MKPFTPPPPPGAQPPPLWGSEEHLQALMGGRVEFHTLERDVLEITAFERPRDYGEHFKALLRADDRRPRQRRPRTAARPSSTRRWTASATSGTAAPRTAPLREGVPAGGGHEGVIPRADATGTRSRGDAAGRESLIEGTQAMERADWEAARVAFEAVLEAGESAEARDGLGQALWFLGDVADGIAMRERAFEEYVRAGRCDDAARMAVWVSHQHFIAGRASAARGWLARSERALRGRRRLRRPRLGGGRAGAARRQRRGADRARAPGDGDRARERRGRPRGVRAQPARPRGGERRAARARHGAARGGDGRGDGRPRAQRPHAGRGLLQPDRGVRRRGRVGARQGVVRDRRRLRPHARDRAAVRRLPHGPRGRPGRGRALAGGRARARERAGHARALHPADGRAGDRQDGRAARAAGAPGGGRAAPGAARRSSRRRCGRSRCCASPRTGRRWRRRCWSAACAAPRATPCGPPQLLAPLVDARLACGDVAGAREAADAARGVRGRVRHPADRRPRRARGRAGGDRRGRSTAPRPSPPSAR